jgi:hypothetical protein
MPSFDSFLNCRECLHILAEQHEDRGSSTCLWRREQIREHIANTSHGSKGSIEATVAKTGAKAPKSCRSSLPPATMGGARARGILGILRLHGERVGVAWLPDAVLRALPLPPPLLVRGRWRCSRTAPAAELPRVRGRAGRRRAWRPRTPRGGRGRAAGGRGGSRRRRSSRAMAPTPSGPSPPQLGRGWRREQAAAREAGGLPNTTPTTTHTGSHEPKKTGR